MTTFTYPFKAINGALEITREEQEKIPQVIRHVVQTRLEERVFRPDWGIPEPIFEVQGSLGDLVKDVEQALLEVMREYPGVDLSVLGSLGDDGQAELYISYQYLETSGTVEI